jgi:hypothetical protein
MAGKPKQNMVPHLSKCVLVDPLIRALAETAKAAITTEKSAVPQHLLRSSSWSHSVSPACPSGPSLSTLSPLPSPLLLSIPLLPEPVSKCKCMSSTFEDSPLSAKAPWTLALQTEFGEDMCKLLIAIRAPWNAANNPQMQIFVQKWVPGAVVPDRRTLSGPILDREATKVEDKLKAKLSGRLATFTTDGWKNKAKQSIVASMVSVASEVSCNAFNLAFGTDSGLIPINISLT